MVVPVDRNDFLETSAEWSDGEGLFISWQSSMSSVDDDDDDKANWSDGRRQGFCFALLDPSFPRAVGSDSLIMDSVLLIFNKSSSSRSISSRLMAASSEMMLARNDRRWREDTLCNDGEPKMSTNGLFPAKMALMNNAHDTIEKNDIIFKCMVEIMEAVLRC
jgi:hypothetical protein